jgi:2-aminoadipate transaminase
MPLNWESEFAGRTGKMRGSAIRELLKLTEQPDFISFAGGLPAPEVFPVEEVERVSAKVLNEHGAPALQYGLTEGYTPLRQVLAERLNVEVENVLITSGSQQALDILGKIFIDPGDYVVTESPTYLGALQAWNAYEAAYVTVPADHDGMITSELEKTFTLNPKFIYALPNFQNPGGFTMTLERRQELLRLATEHNLPIVEDDPYGELRYSGEPLPNLLELSKAGSSERLYNGNVIRLSTFSKILAPGLRLGWVVAAPTVISKMVQAKQGMDLHTSSFNQIVACEMLASGYIDEHIKIIRATYTARRDAMLEALDEYFPPAVNWTKPQGGMFLWVILPEGFDTTELLKAAIERKVAFVPGRSFYPNGGGENCMRLNFSASSPEKIREGIRILGRLLVEAKAHAAV